MFESVKAARLVIGGAAKTLRPGQDAGAHYARALAEAGLLADPAQTTELERLKAFERDSLRQIHASWELASRSQAWREDAEDAEDRLSLLLRGMARKLVAARAELNQEKRDSLWVMNRIRQSLGTPNDRAVSVHAAEVRVERDEAAADVDKFRDYLRMANNLVERRGAERDELQTRIDRALALLQDTPDMELTRVGIDAVRAALVGDQPPPRQHRVGYDTSGEEGDCLDDCPGCKADDARLSGVALRDAEEADDASEPEGEQP